MPHARIVVIGASAGGFAATREQARLSKEIHQAARGSRPRTNGKPRANRRPRRVSRRRK